MAINGLPSNYLAQNAITSKSPVLIVQIEGLNYLLTSGTVSTELLYGSPGAVYGGAGLVYGGVIPYAGFKDLISLDKSSITLQQRLEPEQGKASVSSLSISFVDIDQFMTQLVSPGILIPDILLAQMTLYIGFTQGSFPNDYIKIFKGYVSGVTAGPGLVTLQISDANLKARTTLFYTAQGLLFSDITSTDWMINVENNSGFNVQVDQPDGTAYSTGIHNYIQIDSEWIECEPLFQDNRKYKANIQGLTYFAQPGHGSDVSIIYIGGGTAGSEVVTVSNNTITVQIQVGVSTAIDVAIAIDQIEDARDLVNVIVSPSFSSFPQSVLAQTFLSIQNSETFSTQGIWFFAQAGVSGVTIAYANDGTAGSETVSIVISAITVHMQNGVSTAAGIYKALLAAGALVEFFLLPNAGSVLQNSFTTTAFTSSAPGTQFAVSHRGARLTTPAIHAAQTTVTAGIQVGDGTYPENAMDMALKLYLSGTNGNWIKKIALSSIGENPDPTPSVTTTNILQLDLGVNAISDYNIQPGDFATIYNTAYPSQNGATVKVTRIDSSSTGTNDLIYIDAIINKELTTSATISVRSQYDCYPVNAGLALKPTDIDIAGHIYIKDTFLGNDFNDLIFFITTQETSGKDFIQTEVYYPIGAYGLTRYGQLSAGYNSPPIANQNIVTIDETNILEPQNIQPTRAVNNRNFFNEVDFSYGVEDDGSTFDKLRNSVSSSSLERYGGYVSALPITSRGLYKAYNTDLLDKYATFLLNKYAFGAVLITVKVNWQAGSVIEAGDLCILNDSNGVLQISNFATGKRGLGIQIFQVIDRSFDFKAGNVQLQLQGNAGTSVSDRYATISPSSNTDVGCTTTSLILKDSFGSIFPGDEGMKWQNYIGLTIHVHSVDYSVSDVVTLTGVSTTNNYLLTCSALSFTPAADYIVDIADYPSSTNPTVNAFYKTMHVFLSPTVAIVTGVDQRNFTVSGGDVGKFFVGSIVQVHSVDYSVDSGEVLVVTIVGDQVTVDTPLGFTPAFGQVIDYIGFSDRSAAYRLI